MRYVLESWKKWFLFVNTINNKKHWSLRAKNYNLWETNGLCNLCKVTETPTAVSHQLDNVAVPLPWQQRMDKPTPDLQRLKRWDRAQESVCGPALQVILMPAKAWDHGSRIPLWLLSPPDFLRPVRSPVTLRQRAACAPCGTEEREEARMYNSGRAGTSCMTLTHLASSVCETGFRESAKNTSFTYPVEVSGDFSQSQPHINDWASLWSHR